MSFFISFSWVQALQLCRPYKPYQSSSRGGYRATPAATVLLGGQFGPHRGAGSLGRDDAETATLLTDPFPHLLQSQATHAAHPVGDLLQVEADAVITNLDERLTAAGLTDEYHDVTGLRVLGDVVHRLLEDPEQDRLRFQGEMLDGLNVHLHVHIVLLTEIEAVAPYRLGETVPFEVDGPEREDGPAHLADHLPDGVA